ncbi:MAG TPA: ribosome maturation factor RimM [Vicinamibacterales bacterium]|nr:ribosome maturation factor RimM [Vicinamibacterales bacterium]
MGRSVPAWDDMVLVGTIARPHGIRGEVIVNPTTDFAEQRFAVGATLWTRTERDPEALTVASMRVQGGRPVVGFEGLTRIEEIARLVGRELRIPEEALQPLGEGVYYQHELIGADVITRGGEPVGRVARLEGGGAGSLLVVDGRRGEVLIPLAADICVEVDVAGRRITIDPPEGLLELNEM